MKTPHTFNAAADLLLSQPLTVDVEIEDKHAGQLSVKGLEVDGSVLYMSIPGYAGLSLELDPAELLIYQNMFIGWIHRQLEKERFCVVERFFGHTHTMLFSSSFGAADPFLDALRAARILGENDEPGFRPAIGIASGTVVAGFTGSPGEYVADIFGRPLVLAAACAALKPHGDYAARITVTEEEWRGRSLDAAFPPLEYEHPEKGNVRQPQIWQLGDARLIDLPGSGRAAVRDIVNFIHWPTDKTPETQAREWFSLVRSKGFYKKSRQ
ncbi:MAG: adenylate cyclase [Chlorobium sp.]|uniref:adenylate cyclase n=1 Tax=Chlorobium sp. TaxID=1095 RepID=UPI0025BBE38B|nr:adenylate cyclase [Chlorobium sp.]MCF8216493.1 adenylate cyclase [Chlorobium sp.]MCF8271398.1 adenylate cyclase [Chlorobium sp.]MCF8287770.1 adenylate cyclase [Chlorobium sp.]MCF8291309.1 adenylate cyclase [Chlorobium sp.]MCF8385404.1 adenylate cyclase [Chlorobium sp.]